MPVFRNHMVFELARNVRLLLCLEVGLVGVEETINRIKARMSKKSTSKLSNEAFKAPAVNSRTGSAATAQQRTSAKQDRKLNQARQQLAKKDRETARLLAGKDREISELREMLTISVVSDQDEGISPKNIVWMLGTRRTGSTWLSHMMADLDEHAVWFEPFVGEIFGSAYYTRAWDWQRKRKDFVLSRRYKKVWLKSIRNFVLDGANARFPEVADKEYLIIKEPNGSLGAPLLIEALPESRMIFLLRDPRDIVASDLDAHRKGSWMPELIYNSESSKETLADEDPDTFAKERAELCLLNIEKVKQAYEAHKGRKVLIKYEDLRHDTLGELKKIYASLDIPIEEAQLRLVVEKHDWRNIPSDQKGAGKPQRKATPGSWKEDLTPEQVKIVEQITAPVLEEFYGVER